MSTSLVYNIEIRGTETQAKKLNQLEAELKSIRELRKDLIKQQEAEGKLNAKSEKLLATLTAKEKALSAEKTKVNKAIKDTIRTNSAAAGSYDSLTAANARLTARIKQLADPMGKNNALFRRMAAEVKQNEERLKVLDAQMGRHQRNVGNYTSSIKGAFGSLGLFSRETMIAQQALSVMGAGFSGVTKGAGAFTVAMRVLKAALISSGIGAIVVALGSLVAYFTRSEEGANRFKQVITPVIVTLNNVADVASNVGQLIANMFTFDRAKIKASWDDLKASVTGFYAETRREISEAMVTNEKQFDQDRRIRQSKIMIARNELAIAKERATAAAKETFDASTRYAALQRAMQLEAQNMELQLRIAQVDFEIKKEKAALALNNKAANDELAEAEANLYAVQAASFKLRKTILAEETTTLRELKKEREELVNVDPMKLQQYDNAQRQLAELAMRSEMQITWNQQQQAAKRNKIKEEETLYQIELMTQMAGIAAGMFREGTMAYQVTASAEALMSTYLAANKAYAQLPVPFNFAMAAALTAAGLANVAKINGLEFASGGRVPHGYELPHATPQGDNTLALVKPKEVILNETQQAKLGGARTFKAIGVPGFADGGVIGAPAPPPPSSDMLASQSIRNSIEDIRVFVVENDIREKMRQVDVVESMVTF